MSVFKSRLGGKESGAHALFPRSAGEPDLIEYRLWGGVGALQPRLYRTVQFMSAGGMEGDLRW